MRPYGRRQSAQEFSKIENHTSTVAPEQCEYLDLTYVKVRIIPFGEATLDPYPKTKFKMISNFFTL